MRSYKKNTLIVTGVVSIISLVSCLQNNKESKLLADGFVNPSDTIQTSVYWYWMSDNISKEGVIRDLESMKAVGINRAFIGNIGGQNVPYGDIKVLSPEWWEVTRTALKKATELDIEIGIFNSPGWSQSGGPWVKPEQSMRYLGSADTTISGGKAVKFKLPVVSHYRSGLIPKKGEESLLQQRIQGQDVLILAWPAIKDAASFKKTWKFQKKQADPLVFEMKMDKPETVRSLSFTTDKQIKTEAELFVKDGDEFRLLKKIVLDRSNFSLNVGFYPMAPIVISIPETKSDNFRLVFVKEGVGEMNVTLSSQPQIERYPEKTLAKMFQRPLPMFNDYMWDKQPDVPEALCLDPEKVIDVTGFVKNGILTWNAPEGDWVISRMSMLTTGVTNGPASPESTGLEIDKMSKKHVAAHFDAFIGEILRKIPEADRKTFRVVVEDSYETGGQNWTDDMIESFWKAYEYDPVPYLPVINGRVVGNPDLSDRFLWDLRRLVADRVAYDYVAGLREISNKNGLTTWLENYGHWGFPGEFLQYGGQSDEIGGEFWSEGSLGDIENCAATSCGHIYGKTKISAESNTCGGKAFSRYPATIKQRGDRFFAEGINNTLLHVYITQPYEDKTPGINAPFGNEFNRKNTWFSQIDVYIQYLKRCNYMLQQGLNVADAAYFIGEDAPKMTGVTDPPLPIGYQFDYMNAEVIEKFMTVKDGLITLPHGTQYRILVLPELETMRPELLSKIIDLVQQGAVIMGPPPGRSPSLQNQPEADKKVKEMAAELWGDIDGVKVKSRTVGKGMVINGMNMTEAFELISCEPDCKLPADNSIHYGHRTLSYGDIYFLTNQTAESLTFEPEFRVSGKQPELWEATTGSIRDLPDFTQTENATKVPLILAPYESVFVVFRTEGKPANNSTPNFPEKNVLLTINEPWELSFEGMNAPQPMKMEALQDWSISEDKALRYFSGTAHYKTTFTLEPKPDQPISIDLGNVMVMAKVKINGQYVGGIWTPPYRLDITSAVKEGANTLEVEVVNTWMNRLIGDLNLPEDERSTWTVINPWKKETPLQSSGLIGPVTIKL
ncbi:MAG: glycoside hydrolase family 2 [Bacteroidales bacterium]|nr:glycoside hydrolase family 2 [Bacteroidales bacterium]